MKLKKILLPLDGSSLAAAAIDTAIDLAAGTPITLVLIRAAEAHTIPGADPTDEQVQVVREAEEYLASVCIVRAPGSPLETPQGVATPASGQGTVNV